MTVEELMAESLAYERAIVRLGTVLRDLGAEKNQAYYEAKERGEKLDAYHKILIDALETTRKILTQTSSDLWNQAEKKANIHQPAVENLANAVVERAVLDYETAISGADQKNHYKSDVERFARDNASDFTSIDVNSILRKVREAYLVFAKTVAEHCVDILVETRERRKKFHDLENNKYKCPMCGGGIYAYGRAEHGFQTFCCTGCSLTAKAKIPLSYYLDEQTKEVENGNAETETDGNN